MPIMNNFRRTREGEYYNRNQFWAWYDDDVIFVFESKERERDDWFSFFLIKLFQFLDIFFICVRVLVFFLITRARSDRGPLCAVCVVRWID
jgi:hypothetical protein